MHRSGDPLRHATANLGGARSFAAIPTLAGDRLVGAFTIYRQRVRRFNETAMALARTFADQSVIAIENARLTSALRDVRAGVLPIRHGCSVGLHPAPRRPPVASSGAPEELSRTVSHAPAG